MDGCREAMIQNSAADEPLKPLCTRHRVTKTRWQLPEGGRTSPFVFNEVMSVRGIEKEIPSNFHFNEGYCIFSDWLNWPWATRGAVGRLRKTLDWISFAQIRRSAVCFFRLTPTGPLATTGWKKSSHCQSHDHNRPRESTSHSPHNCGPHDRKMHKWTFRNITVHVQAEHTSGKGWVHRYIH